jgi:hypothetical protein
MAYLYYTIVAIVLYLASDWILNLIERRVGKRLEYRSIIFFVIISVLAVTSFSFIEKVMTPPDTTTPAGTIPTQ